MDDDQLLSSICRKKQIEAHNIKLQKGESLNRPPLGYKVSKEYKIFIPDGDKAIMTKKIFEERAKGLGKNQIAKKFNLSYQTTTNILKNKTYLGYFMYDGEWLKGKHEPLIDQKTFDKCQEQKE